MNENKNELANKELTQSQRFMNKVIAEFGSGVGPVAMTSFQRLLAQNYFIVLDSNLRSAEEKRLKKSENKRDPVPVAWANVNMEKLARDVVSAARIGYDPMQPNHINLIPWKNNNTGKYDIVFMEGYRGIELKSSKYGLTPPDDVTVELVYSKDKFKPIKKDANNPYDGYEFAITDPFDRGEIKGGFYYHQYSNPLKNKLVVMSIKDILKRKPEHASTEFWGGEKDVWKNGQKTGEKEQVEGWYEKMCWKTVYRAAYGDITIDSTKIDEDYLRMKQMEMEYAEAEVEREINENANGDVIDITPTSSTTVQDKPQADPESQHIDDENLTEGPGF